MVNLCGTSSTGKSTAEMLMCSPFMNPEIGKKKGLCFSANSTQNAMFALIDGIFGVPFVIDDITTNPNINLLQFIYTLASGSNKNRLNGDSSLRDDGCGWSGVAVTSSESCVLDNISQYQGLKVRVLHTQGIQWTKNAAEAELVKRTVRKNFGFTGKDFAMYVSTIHNVQIGDSAGGQPPYGLKVVNKQFEINEDEAPAIRTMFSMAAKGKSYSQIVEKLNSLGYKTRKGGEFSYSTISDMLRNDKYYGTYVYNRENGKRRKGRVLIEKFAEERNSKAIPPIITKATFDKVQTMLDNRKTCRPRQNVNSEYFLTGYITCKSCGGSMSGQSNVGGRNNKRSRYYACLNHSSRRNGVCKTKNINADYLENAVKSILTEKINEYLLSAEAESVFSIMKLSKTEEVKSLNKSIKRLRSKYRFVA